MSSAWLTVAAIGALAAVGMRRGSRSYDQVERALELVPELRRRWVQEEGGGDEEEDEFFLMDFPDFPPATRRWFEDQTGLAYLGHGNHRIVFRMSDGDVLKLALDIEGEKANELETAAWEEYGADPRVRDYLVPLIAGNEDFVIMEHATPLSSPMDLKTEQEFTRRHNRWQRMAFEGLHDVYDTSMRNWGRHDGKLKLLDYEAYP